MRHILLALLIAAPASAQNADAIWQSLVAGNRAYVAGKVTFDHLADQRKHSADHQNPPVTVLSCSDSRVPPELIFNRSLDQLFVIRVAGNVAADFELASIEYAIANGYTKLIVVLGHENCGAVKAAMADGDAATPSLAVLLQRIRKSFAPKPATLQAAIGANARASAAYLLGNSKIIREAVDGRRVGLIVAYYHLDSGVVERLR
ncbi:MAG TPA: carbonic anhydrase [Thermoanaerobaculia bacterium]|nr:carbonic anhydrase [Thermoanaerobaculia bacterium]